MRVVDFKGAADANTIEELEAMLQKKYDNGCNMFSLSHGDQEYPSLTIVVKDNFAAVFYMPKEYEPGLRSIGKMPGLKAEETTTFFLNTGEKLPVINDAVLPFPVALRAAKEFFFSNEPPRSIEWFEL